MVANFHSLLRCQTSAEMFKLLLQTLLSVLSDWRCTRNGFLALRGHRRCAASDTWTLGHLKCHRSPSLSFNLVAAHCYEILFVNWQWFPRLPLLLLFSLCLSLSHTHTHSGFMAGMAINGGHKSAMPTPVQLRVIAHRTQSKSGASKVATLVP